MDNASSVTFGRRSPELGDPLLNVPSVAHDANGRPIRTTRGKRKEWSQQWLDPGTVPDLDDSPHEIESDDASSSSDEAGETNHAPKQLSRKRKRDHTPEGLNKPMMVAEQLHALPDWLGTSTPDHDDNLSDHAFLEDPERTLVPASPTTRIPSNHTTLHMTVNVPVGHHGPITLQLLPAAGGSPSHELMPQCSELPSKSTSPTNTSRTGFLDLPAELRNKVYRRVFVDLWPLDFAHPWFSRSAAFLRTCKQVHDEGCSILYGENTFNIVRRQVSIPSMWSEETSEIGFAAVRRFLQIIGPANILRLRHVAFLLEDAVPRINWRMDPEERRFVYDENLFSIIRRLSGPRARLQTLYTNFHGRRRFVASRPADARFLKAFTRIRADDVHFETWHVDSVCWAWWGKPRQDGEVTALILRTRSYRNISAMSSELNGSPSCVWEY